MRKGLLLATACAASCLGSEAPPPAPWTPGTTYATLRAPGPRGFLDRRGLIHAHSVYSHDACDNMPDVEGGKDQVCFADFHRGLCQSKHDFVMLTDHETSFRDNEFPDLLLYREARGDRLVLRAGKPVANWAKCDDGRTPLVMAGVEQGFMPVGLEAHADGRGAVYGERTKEAALALKAKNAVVLVAHTEEWTPEQLLELPVDGFEMFNLHANSLLNAGPVLELLLRNDRGDTDLPHPDLAFVPVVSEDARYLKTWGTVLARGFLDDRNKRVTTMGTDCHRNTFKAKLADGERVDSYRRMMIWFSNHLLIRPKADGSWDDLDLKEALRAGRLYGAFEMLGYPEGFDFRAEVGAKVSEMGEAVLLRDAPRLVVIRPKVQNLDPARKPPALKLRILRAVEGGFEEVAASEGEELAFTPSAQGAYRAEVRMTPHHVRPEMNQAVTESVWIYSNPIYVR